MSSFHSSHKTHLFTPDAANNPWRVKNTPNTMSINTLWYLVVQNSTVVYGVSQGLSSLSLYRVTMQLLNPGSNPTTDLWNMLSPCLSPCVYCYFLLLSIKVKQQYPENNWNVCVCPWCFDLSFLSEAAVSRGQINMIKYYLCWSCLHNTSSAMHHKLIGYCFGFTF